MSILKISGLLFFLGGSLMLMGIITAEAFYPAGYSTTNSEISDLGSTAPPNSIIYQPSATIFNVTMALAGLLILISTILQHSSLRRLYFSLPLLLFGIGLAGVGFFPGNVAPFHGIFSMLLFLAGGSSAVLSFKVVTTPFNYIGVLFGLIGLTTWFLAVFSASFPISSIGDGGTERWVAYPIMLWIMGFGGYLMNQKIIPNEKQNTHHQRPSK
jgi:hypothetical membrane protein